jgi:hypothetical protein
MDVPLKPDTPWGTEVRTLMCEQDLGFDDAFARVMEKYFRTGEIGPLADLLIRGRVEVGEPAIRFLAATLNPVNSDSTVLNIRYRFGFTATRRRGRPKRMTTKRRLARLLWQFCKPVPRQWRRVINRTSYFGSISQQLSTRTRTGHRGLTFLSRRSFFQSGDERDERKKRNWKFGAEFLLRGCKH